jgi:hypothetical protein
MPADDRSVTVPERLSKSMLERLTPDEIHLEQLIDQYRRQYTAAQDPFARKSAYEKLAATAAKRTAHAREVVLHHKPREIA